MTKSVKELLIGVRVKQTFGDPLRGISKLSFDSRTTDEETLFFAIKGERFDGHQFISQVIEKGCKAIVCEECPEGLPSDICVVQVDDSHEALGIMASGFFEYPSQELSLVGITGTNGKTTIATLLYELFRDMGMESGLFSTVANYIGDKKINATHTTPDPITLNALLREMVNAGCEYCFMEVSSHAVAQNRIAGLYYAGGVFTNLTHDHLDYHITFDAYLKAKKAFFDKLPKTSFALTNIDDKNGMIMMQNSKAKIASYSVRAMADFKGKVLESMFEGMQLLINNDELWTPFIGKFNASNLLAVFGVAILLDQSKDEVLLSLSRLKSVNGRFETIRSSNGITAVVDYAHTPDALKNVIETINDIRQVNQKLISVVGAGGDRDRTKRPEMAKIAVAGSDKVILTSDNPRSESPDKIIEDMMEGVDFKSRIKVVEITNRKEAIKTACMLSKSGDIILVAGKGHETYQEIQGEKHDFDDKQVIREVFEMLS